MNVVQCTFCKRPFMQISNKICPACLEKIDKDFVKVRDFIYDNKFAGIDAAAEETGVDQKIIMYLVKEGRLIIDSPDGEGGGMLHCESCKKPINTGRLCSNCSDSISNKMTSRVVHNNPDKPAVAGKEGESEVQNLRGTAKIGK